MIKTKTELMECLKYERMLYKSIGYKGKFHAHVTNCEVGYLYRFIEALRYDEFYAQKSGILSKILGIYWRRRHNSLGIKLGISIPVNTFGKGLLIFHSQGIIVHREARIGQNCRLHGMNCIGNNGKEIEGKVGAPMIGDDLDLGVGASIIGDIKIADNVTVAAGAVVCKPCTHGTILRGIPAVGIKSK